MYPCLNLKKMINKLLSCKHLWLTFIVLVDGIFAHNSYGKELVNHKLQVIIMITRILVSFWSVDRMIEKLFANYF